MDENKNIETSYIFNSLIQVYANGNVSKLALLIKKDRSYINRMKSGKHSIGFENLINICRLLEEDYTSNSFQIIEKVILKIKNFST